MAFSYDNYTGNGTTTQFSITFTYQDTSEISVTVDGVAETGLTFPSASTVQLTSAPAVGTLVQVRRTTNLSARAVDFASGSVLTEEDLDDSNIQVFHAAQESADLAADSIQLDNDNKWDAQNSVIKNVGTPTASTDAATKGYTDTEVAGVVSSAVSQATTAAVSAANTAVATATGNIIPDATKLAIHPIGTQYTLSDGVTTDYSSKHYANVASTNATTATNAASAASTDATTASTAATAAQVAQAAAEAALDTFDDRFLGAKASDPTVDNDGNALLDGAIYFNTTEDIMKVYDATNTVWHDLALTGTDQTNVNLVAGQISPTNNIATVAGISADITTTATNDANITTVANDIANVNTVGTNITSVVNAANSIASINNFGDTYFVSATAPASPTLGDLWFDTTNDVMKVYGSGGFVNAGSSVNGTSNRYNYVVGTASGTYTGSTTVFPATYDAGYVDVYLNGAKLTVTSDFTATNGTDVTLATAATTSDVVDIVAYGTFTAATALSLGDNEKIQLGASQDLQIYHDGADSFIKDTGTGQLWIASDDYVGITNSAANEFKARFNTNGSVQLYYDNSEKLATTATGVDVTGTVTASGDIIRNDTTTGTSKFALQYSGSDAAVFKRNNSTGVATIANGYAGAPVDAINIDLAGNVLVGTTSTPSTLISATSGGGIALDPNSFSAWNREATASNHSHLVLNQTGVDAQYFQFRKDGSAVGSIGTSSGNFFLSGASKGFRFGSSSVVPSSNTGADSDNNLDLGYSSSRFKDLYLSGGVYLGGTGSANYLDDYEEGTWTPVIDSGAFTSITYGQQYGTYTKVGNLVTAYITLQFSGTSAGGEFRINGLPFASKFDNAAKGMFIVYSSASTYLTEGNPNMYIGSNQTYIRAYKPDGNSANSNANASNDWFEGVVVYNAG